MVRKGGAWYWDLRLANVVAFTNRDEGTTFGLIDLDSIYAVGSSLSEPSIQLSSDARYPKSIKRGKLVYMVNMVTCYIICTLLD